MSLIYFRTAFIFVILIELLSLFAWFLPWFNLVCFGVILIITLILSLQELKYGIFIALTELIIGSHGYLFSFKYGPTLISIRIGIFMVVMLAWVIYILKTGGWINFWRQFKQFKFFKPYLFLAGILLWGVIWGLTRGNNFGYLFLDFNNWLFFLYLLPLVSLQPRFNQTGFWRELSSIGLAALTWLTVKTIFFLYIFSHQFVWAMPEFYKWIRDTRVGEITMMANNFYRIFLQSQIYALLSFLILLPVINLKSPIQKKYLPYYFLLIVLLLTTVIISFSRSFWLGLAASVVIYYVWIFFKQPGQIIKYILNLCLIFIFSVTIIFLIINLPPQIKGEDLGSLISRRTTQIEAAGSSRLNMLKPLTRAIIKHPLIGSGFGATVTYRSADPRVLSTTAGASGQYTTYAFEWSYLDLWLKIGWLGLLIYLWLLVKILQTLWQQFNLSPLNLGISLALLALLVVNIFTPYLNHPLGIGFILLATIYSAQGKPKLFN